MRGAVYAGCLLVLSGNANAASCWQIESDVARLTCFDAARRCASIESDADRLACFDEAYAGDADNESPAAATHSPAPAELSASPEDYADRTAGRSGRERIEATIVGITTNAHDIDFLTLDNGHVWRENEDSRVRFGTGSRVTIEEGMFGSFNLTMDGAPRSVKVKRVK